MRSKRRKAIPSVTMLSTVMIAVGIGICAVVVRMTIRGTRRGTEQCRNRTEDTRHLTEKALRVNRGSVMLLGRLARMFAIHPSSAWPDKTMKDTTLCIEKVKGNRGELGRKCFGTEEPITQTHSNNFGAIRASASLGINCGTCNRVLVDTL